MRRLLAFLTAAVLFFCLVGGYSVYLNQTAIGNANPVNDYLLDRRKFRSPAFIQNNLDDKTMLVFGSSEFSTTSINTHPENLFLKQGYNFNTMLVGQGYYQSLWHAIALGALENSVKNRKVSIIVSAQWFSKEGISPSAFTGTYSKAMMLDFMKNPSISDKLKDQVGKRVKSLDSNASFVTVGETKQNLLINLEDYLTRMKTLNDVTSFKTTAKQSYPKNKDVASIDWNMLLSKAEADGKSACTNNEYGINNKYYDTYVKNELAKRKGSEKSTSYSVSPEYADFQLFLDVCKETKIEPLIIIVPLNGSWADYTQFPKEERQKYYQNIRNLCDQNHISYADFSNKEYEKYFLSDVMHLGWKGWVYVNEAIVDFYKQN